MSPSGRLGAVVAHRQSAEGPPSTRGAPPTQHAPGALARLRQQRSNDRLSRRVPDGLAMPAVGFEIELHLPTRSVSSSVMRLAGARSLAGSSTRQAEEVPLGLIAPPRPDRCGLSD